MEWGIILYTSLIKAVVKGTVEMARIKAAVPIFWPVSGLQENNGTKFRRWFNGSSTQYLSQLDRKANPMYAKIIVGNPAVKSTITSRILERGPRAYSTMAITRGMEKIKTIGMASVETNREPTSGISKPYSPFSGLHLFEKSSMLTVKIDVLDLDAITYSVRKRMVKTKKMFNPTRTLYSVDEFLPDKTSDTTEAGK